MGDLNAAAAVFKALGSRDRLLVLEALSEPKTIPQLRVEHALTYADNHLSVLASAGLVERLPGVTPRLWQRVPGSVEQLARLVSR